MDLEGGPIYKVSTHTEAEEFDAHNALTDDDVSTHAEEGRNHVLEELMDADESDEEAPERHRAASSKYKQ